jgi:hypothetical protein
MPEKGIFARNFFFTKYFYSILFEFVFSKLDTQKTEEKIKKT